MSEDDAIPITTGIAAGKRIPQPRYSMPIGDLRLSVRGHDALKRSGWSTVGQLLQRTPEELLAQRNFGRRSYDELRERLDDLGILPFQPDQDMGGAIVHILSSHDFDPDVN